MSWPRNALKRLGSAPGPSLEDDEVEVLAEAPEEQILVVQLATLLEIDIALARRALQQSHWDLNAAVDIACNLVSSASSCSAHPLHIGSDRSVASATSRAPIQSRSPATQASELHASRSACRASSSSNAAVDSDCNLFSTTSSSSAHSVHFGSDPSMPLATSRAPIHSSSLVRQTPESHASPSADRSTSNQPLSLSENHGNNSVPSPESRSHMRPGASKTVNRALQSSLAVDVPDVFVPATGQSAKKRRLGETSSPVIFKIPNNNGDPPAPNPPLFRTHPLREEQRRSLYWMISEETKLQMQAADGKSHGSGGLLADRMGYGKTSTAIGLISLGVHEPLRQPGQEGIPLIKGDGYIPSDTTLILCPSHLVDQWECEFWKFLGSSGVQISRPQEREMQQTSCAFKCRIGHHGEKGLGITTKPSKQRYPGKGARITEISPERQRQIAEIGLQDALQVGDVIVDVEVKRLVKRVQGTDLVTGVSSIRRKGCYSSIRDVLREDITHHTSRRMGDDSHGNPTFSTERTSWHFTEESTATFTVLRPLSHCPRAQVVRGDGPLKLLIVRNICDLHMLEQQDFISRFHVVLASVGIHADLKYAECIAETSGGSGLMAKKVSMLRKEVKGWCDATFFEAKALRRTPALFEVVFWRRVVFDEFHESESWEYRVREMLKGFGAVHKWGLSGTPPLGNPTIVAEVACLLGFATEDQNGNTFAQALYHTRLGGSEYNKRQWFASNQNQMGLKAAAEEFVKYHIRQNTSQLIEQIAVVEHEEFVEHTREERLIYRQICHDQGIFDLTSGYDSINLDARAEMLKRCAHFDLTESAESALSAVRTLGENKRNRVVKLEEQLWVEVARVRLFNKWDSGRNAMCSTGIQHPDAKCFVEGVLTSSEEQIACHINQDASSTGSMKPKSGKLTQSMRVSVKMLAQDGSLRLRPEVRLIQPIPESEYYKDDRQRHAVVHAVAKKARNSEADEALSSMAVCEHACNGCLKSALCNGLVELVTLLDQAHRSLQFYKQQLNTLTQQVGDTENECSICLESTTDMGTMAILPCSHVFHSDCIRSVLANFPQCPECRAPVQRSQISSIVMELNGPAPSTPEAPTPMSSAWRQHGSKLNAVARKLRDIRQQDPKAKAVVFVQWVELEEKVQSALRDHDVPFLCLSSYSRSRSCQEDGAVLREFQEDSRPEAPYALVLSLQRAAAGTNLTLANHVLFVHPMNAETVQTAAAYERQALARVRRIGQTRKEVHVWRFVTRQTVEEHIWKLHRDVPDET